VTNRPNRQIVLARRPEGTAKESDFRLVEGPMPVPGAGEALVRVIFLSVDPYMRGRMSDAPSYTAPVPVGGVMVGGTAGEVVESKDASLKPGDLVEGYLGWQEYGVAKAADLRRLDPAAAPVSTALGVLGMPGLTAYFGLLEVGRPKPGETVFVSAGTDAKVEHVRRELGFDAAFNYKTCGEFGRALDLACPSGIDVYFDNVGGPITDAVMERINLRARVVICGQIAGYDRRGTEQGPRNLWQLIVKRARIEGMLVSDFYDRAPGALAELGRWVREGRLKYREDVVDGLENAPRAFLRLFRGENMGKQLVRVGADAPSV
jgi:NADPH-dependent curcumin reductase CurA